jgi:hypothetical protein
MAKKNFYNDKIRIAKSLSGTPVRYMDDGNRLFISLEDWQKALENDYVFLDVADKEPRERLLARKKIMDNLNQWWKNWDNRKPMIDIDIESINWEGEEDDSSHILSELNRLGYMD